MAKDTLKKFKISNQDVFVLNEVAGKWVENNPNESKLKYAIENKIAKRIAELIEKYQNEVEDIKIENCSVDKSGNILRGDKGELSYTKAAETKKIKELRNLWKKQVEIEPHIVEFNGVLTDFERETFEGVLIDKKE